MAVHSPVTFRRLLRAPGTGGAVRALVEGRASRLFKGLLAFSVAWLAVVVALAVLVPDTRLSLRDEGGFVEQASWMLHSGALIVATAVLWSARARRTDLDWLLIPLILLGLASELSAFERLFGGVTLGPVFIDAPHDLVTLLVVEAVNGRPVAVTLVVVALAIAGGLVAHALREERLLRLIRALSGHAALPFALIALAFVVTAFSLDAITASTGTFGIVLGVPEESLEMLAALALLLGAGSRWREVRAAAE